MTRELPEVTCSQRGDPACVSDQTLSKGFEAEDVPAAKVGYALLGLMGAVAISLAAIGGLIAWMDHQSPSPSQAGFRQRPILAPATGLASEPRGERLEIQAPPSWTTADERRIDLAMRAIARAGWRDSSFSAANPTKTARAHVMERH